MINLAIIVIPTLIAGWLLSKITSKMKLWKIVLITITVILLVIVSVALGFNLVMNFWYGFGGNG